MYIYIDTPIYTYITGLAFKLSSQTLIQQTWRNPGEDGADCHIWTAFTPTISHGGPGLIGPVRS